MKKLILSVALLTVSYGPAFAQDNGLALCKLRGQQMATAYQPGVDVRGNAVVAADVNASPSMGLDVVRIPMTVDLAQRLGSVPAGVEMAAANGMIEIHKDGRVSFNGQDMTEVAVVLCDNNKPAQYNIPAAGQAPVRAPGHPAVVENAVAAPAVPVVPLVPAAPARPIDKVVVPVDAPALPQISVPVTKAVASPNVQQPIMSSIRTDADARVNVEPAQIVPSQVSVTQIPQGAMATKPLPPHTLGQFIIPAQKAPQALQAPVTAPAVPVAPAPNGVVRPPVVQDDSMIFGQGN